MLVALGHLLWIQRADDSCVDFQARERFVEATSIMSAELGVDASMLGLRLSLSHQEPEIAPHTPAVPEGHYDMVLPPLPNEAAQERSWHHDLNGSGEG